MNVCRCNKYLAQTCIDDPDCRPSYCRIRWRAGVLFRWGSLWVGAHWAGNHKRLYINFVPCVTVWIVAPGGDVP